MTWVIGMPGFLSRGVLVGDIRISLQYADGRTAECEGVQKIYAVSQSIGAGFAGNIETGFRMIGDMGGMLARSVLPGTLTTEPSRFIAKWSGRARHHWANTLTPHDREGCCELLVVAALPQPGPFARTVAYTLRAPTFEPQRIPDRTAASIGSGGDVPEYRAEVERLADDFKELIQFDTMYWPHGPAPMVAIGLSDAIEAEMAPGISPHLHICSVRFGEVTVFSNDRQALTPGAQSRVMPPVAAGWQGWQEWKRRHGLPASAVAVA